MPLLWGDLEEKLALRKQQHLMRQRATLESAQAAKVTVGGKSFDNFCSNDYLGLANHPLVVEAFTAAAKKYGVGGGASHLVCGHSTEHHLLEEEFAAFTGRDKALLFSTGFMANLAIISALFNQKDAVFEDKLNHASLIDGVRLSGAKSFRFAHNDLQHLQRRLEKAQSLGVRNKLICVDAVFSMDGDTAPLTELAALAKRYDAVLMADDAHGFGILGARGAGLCEQLDLSQDDVPILMATLGKAMGSAGALVAGSNLLIESLVQFARPYIYTTSMPPAVAAASRQSLRLLRDESWRRKHLADLIAYFQEQAQLLSLPIMPSNTAIQPLLIGDEALAVQCQQALYEQGFWISAIRTPTVAKGMARLRITLTANHGKDDIDRLLRALQQLPFDKLSHIPLQGLN